MKKLLCIASLLIITSCSSNIRIERISSFGDINMDMDSYKYVRFFQQKTNANSFSTDTPEDIRKILNKGLSFHEQSKGNQTNFSKDIDNSVIFGSTYSYNHKKDEKMSSITLCLRDNQYQVLVVHFCDSVLISDIPSKIEDLSDKNVARLLDLFKAQEESENKLK